MTLDRALALAAERSPAFLAARHEQAAADGAVRGAGAQSNPVVTGGVGVRTPSAGMEFAVSLSQSLTLAEVGPRRRAATAEADASGAWAADTWRRVVAGVSAAFLRVQHAEQRVRIADESVRVAAEVLDTVRARADLGDAADLEVIVAELAHSRARARAATERAGRELAAGDLRLALDLESSLVLVTGPLLDRARYAPHLATASGERPDVQAKADELRLAEARQRLAQARAVPEVGLWGEYANEEGDSIVTGGLSLELPLFDRAQGARGEAAARLRQAEEALALTSRAASAQLDTASAVYELRLEAVDALEAVALPRAVQQSEAARRAYDLGGLALPELLLIRGQAFEARLEHVDAELAAALAGVELLEAAGWTP